MPHGGAPVMSSGGVGAEEPFASGAEELRPTILLVTFDRLRNILKLLRDFGVLITL